MATRVHPINKVRRSGRKSSGKKGFYLSYAEQVSIIHEYLQGGPENSITKIAERRKRSRAVVSQIVQSDLADQLMEAATQASKNYVRDEILPLAGPTIKKGLKNSKIGPQLAFDLLDRYRVIPPKLTQRQLEASQRPGEPKEEPDVRRARLVGAFSQVFFETRKAYGLPIPDEDEVFAPVRKRTIDISLGKE